MAEYAEAEGGEQLHGDVRLGWPQQAIRTMVVYIYFADRVDKNGECWPAIPTIVSDLKYSQSTVRRGIRDLEKAGLLEAEQRYRLCRFLTVCAKPVALSNQIKYNKNEIMYIYACKGLP